MKGVLTLKTSNNEQEIRTIKKLFGEINTPVYDILEGVKLQMNQKSKKSRPKIKAVVLVAIFALIFTTGAVWAAYQTTGGFGRLRLIVGDERAEGLTPIEAEDILEIPYLSGGFRNPHEDRFAIELVATYGEVGGIMDFYFSIEDLTGARQNCDFSNLGFTLHTGNNAGGGLYVHGNATEIISICDSGIMTLRGRTNGLSRRDASGNIEYYGSWSHPPFEEGTVPEDLVHNGALTITVTHLDFNVGYISNQHIGFDLGTVQVLTPDEIRLVTKADFAADFPFDWQFPSAEDRALLEGSGVPLPRKGLLNWEIDVHRVDTQISSIGIIDNKLYIVQWEPMPHYSKFSALSLRGPNGETIHANRSLLFSLCPNGTFYQGMFRRDTAISLFARGYFSNNPYQILIFEGLDLSRLGEHSISGTFDTGYSIWLEWTVTFPVE